MVFVWPERYERLNVRRSTEYTGNGNFWVEILTKKETPKSSEIWNTNARKIGKILSLSLLNKDR